MTASRQVTRDDIERALYRWTEWRVDQRGIDEIMSLVDRLAPVLVEPADTDMPTRRAAKLSTAVSAEAYRAPGGALWLRLGDLPDELTDVVGETRQCSWCRGVKAITRFRKDKASKGGRRARCQDCENSATREREANKKRKVIKGVQS